MTTTVVFITSGATYTVPSDFNSLISIEALGAGGNGSTGVSNTSAGGGGGGGAYAKIITLAGIAASNVYNIQIGTAGGTTGSGTAPTTNTWFNNASTLVAAGGATPAGTGVGAAGSTANSVGSTKTAGGTGASSTTGGAGGAGGGGSAGPTGIGKNGGGGGGSALSGGSGGGGSNGGSATNGAAVGGPNGSNGGNGTSGAGGGTGGAPGDGGNGTVGGGGGGGSGGVGPQKGGNGAMDSAWDSTHGASGGGGAGGAGNAANSNGGAGGNAGTYGGGGGGYGSNGGAGTGTKGASGTGGQGLIVFTYDATVLPAPDFSSWESPTDLRSPPKVWASGLYPFLAYTEAKTQNAPNNNFAEQSFYDRYAYPWSEPVRFKPGLAAPRQQVVAEPPYAFISTVPRFSWKPPFGEPVRVKLGEKPENQQFLAYVAAKTQNAPHNDFAEQTQYDKYAYPWSEPSAFLAKRGLGAHLQHYFEFQPAPMNVIIGKLMPWFNPLSIPPVLTKPGIISDLQHYFEMEPDPPEPDMEISWFAPLGSPVMVKQWLKTANQPVATISPYIPSYYPFDKGYVIE